MSNSRHFVVACRVGIAITTLVWELYLQYLLSFSSSMGPPTPFVARIVSAVVRDLSDV